MVKSGVPHKCREKQRAAARKHYLDNREKYLARAAAHNVKAREKGAELIRKAKDVPCSDCGRRYPYYVMQFDHVRGEKRFNVGDFRRRNCGLPTIQAEIDKCDVVCGNCHAIRTYERGQRHSTPKLDQVVSVLDTLF